MRVSREIVAICVLLFGIAGGTVFIVLGLRGSAAPLEHATMLPEALPLPAFELLDHHGNRFSNASFEGRWNLVFFGFTHCPDICPGTLAQLSVARNRMAANGMDELPRIVLVSVDPDRDDPATLAAYVPNFGEDVIGVTGPLDALRQLTGPLGIYFEHEEAAADGSYGVDHSAVVIVIDDEARFRAVFGAPHQIGHFTTDLPKIVDRK